MADPIRFAVVAFEGDTVVTLPESAFTARQQAAVAHIVQHRGVDPLPAPNAAAPILVDLQTSSPTERVAKAGAARAQGYTGECCQNATCGGFRVRRNGSCFICDDCGSTTGCS